MPLHNGHMYRSPGLSPYARAGESVTCDTCGTVIYTLPDDASWKEMLRWWPAEGHGAGCCIYLKCTGRFYINDCFHFDELPPDAGHVNGAGV